MQKAARHTIRAVVVATAAALALAACSRSERQEVRTEAKQATNATANVVDNAALTTKVKAALIADEMVKGTQINVDSNAGDGQADGHRRYAGPGGTRGRSRQGRTGRAAGRK